MKSASPLDPEFVKLLANPLLDSRPPLHQVGDYLVCEESGMGFPIVDGIPHLLPENAIPAERMKELLRES